MMANPRPMVPRRSRIFVGCEGDCEIALVAWLQRLCDARRLCKHLDRGSGAAGGGDTLAIVERCSNFRSRGHQKGAYAHSFIILDWDRVAGDGERGRRAIAKAEQEGFRLLFSKPNFEGLLLRLFERHVRDDPPADRTLDALRHEWPDYRKPPIAVDLEKRFTVEDLQRAARFDDDLAALLRAIGLR